MNLNAHRLPVALATLSEPGAHGFRETFRLDAETRFQETFSNRKCVIKLGLAGEIAHTKIVKPIERARTAFALHDEFDAQLLSVHEASITCPAARKARAAPNSLLLPNQRTRIINASYLYAVKLDLFFREKRVLQVAFSRWGHIHGEEGGVLAPQPQWEPCRLQ
jgi:hypothetical protein